MVEARENSTQEPQGEVSQHTEDDSGEDGEADPDPEIPEVLTEEPEMPDAGAELIDLTPKEDKGMFLSVVPAAMEQQKEAMYIWYREKKSHTLLTWGTILLPIHCKWPCSILSGVYEGFPADLGLCSK